MVSGELFDFSPVSASRSVSPSGKACGKYVKGEIWGEKVGEGDLGSKRAILLTK